MPKDQNASQDDGPKKRSQLDTWRRRFRAAARKWSGMIPRGSTVSTTGAPTYYVRVPRADVTTSSLPQNDAEWSQLGWTFKDIQSEDGTFVRVRSARPEPNRTSPLGAAATTLAETCRAFAHDDGDVLHLVGIRLQTALRELADALDADPDPATFEQRQGVREVERLLDKNALFHHLIAEDGITEQELVRLDRKRERVEDKCPALPELYSLWQETTDLLSRTNLHESSRAEELLHLQAIASRLAASAQERGMPRAALQALRGRLRMLMPHEWFNDAESRKQVLDDICDANAEVEELVQATGTAPAAAQRTKGASQRPPAAAATPESAMLDKLVTAEEAAEALGKPQRTIRNWLKRGRELEPVDRLGGPRKVAARYHLKDIAARQPDGR